MKEFKSNETALNKEDGLAANILKLLNIHRMNESELARQLQLPYNTIHRLITGSTSDPRVSTLQLIADYFGVGLDYLFNKEDSYEFSNPKKTYNVPILNWSFLVYPNFKTALLDHGVDKCLTIAQIDNFKDRTKLFAIKSTKSMQPRFPAGTTFIVHVEEAPIDGDLVIIRFKDNTVSLRELVIDSPQWQLKPIIPGSSPLIFNAEEHTVVGVIILTLIHTRA